MSQLWKRNVRTLKTLHPNIRMFYEVEQKSPPFKELKKKLPGEKLL